MRYHHRNPSTHCHLCPVTFPSKEKAVRHFREVHQDSSYVCPKCGKQFKRLANVLIHQKSVHGSEKGGKCTVSTEHHCVQCPIKFKEKKHLKEHIKRKHQNFIKSGSSFYICEKYFEEVQQHPNKEELVLYVLWQGVHQEV